jgi:hypothetical protein
MLRINRVIIKTVIVTFSRPCSKQSYSSENPDRHILTSRLCKITFVIIHFSTLNTNALSSVNTRSASGVSLPESANGGQIDHRRVVYCLFIYIMLSGERKYLKIIIYHHKVFVSCFIHMCQIGLYQET